MRKDDEQARESEDMVIEEIVDLTKELLNDRGRRECNIAKEIADVRIMLEQMECNIAEEIVDIRIMLEQMEILFQHSEEVEARFWEKIERLNRRMEKREEDELMKEQKAAEQMKDNITR